MSLAGGKKLLLRADGSSLIGHGHLMRLLALGQAWIDCGGSATLATRDCPGDLRQRFIHEGIQLILLTEQAPLEEANTVLELARSQTADFMVIDGYQFDSKFQSTLHRTGLGLMMVDDYRHLNHYHADLILNQNLGATADDYLSCAPQAEILAGLGYTLLRREFTNLRSCQHDHVLDLDSVPVARNVLVTLGGADPNNVSQLVLNGLRQLADLDLQVRLLIGRQNPHLSSLKKLTERCPNFTAMHHIDNMVEQYRWAQVAIVAGGSTNWEICRFGLPRLVIVLAENQAGIARRLAEFGAAINLGYWQGIDEIQIANSVRRLIVDPGLRQAQADVSSRLVDGRGTERVVNAIVNWINQRRSGNDGM